MAIDMQIFKRAYESSHGKSDNVAKAVEMYCSDEDYTALPDGAQIIDAYTLLGEYLSIQREESKSNSG